MEKHGMTDEDLERIAKSYEDASFVPEESGEVFSGSHLDAAGKRRVTVVYDASDAREVARIASDRGVEPSTVYRDALAAYLARA